MRAGVARYVSIFDVGAADEVITNVITCDDPRKRARGSVPPCSVPEHGAVDLGERAPAGELHCPLELGAQDLDHAPNAVVAAQSEAVAVRPADEHGAGA